MLKIVVLFLLRSMLDGPSDGRNIIGVDAIEHHLDGGLARGVVPKNLVALVGPKNLAARHVPAEAAGVAQVLCFGEEGFLHSPQRGFSPLALGDIGIALQRTDRFSLRVPLQGPPAFNSNSFARTRRVDKFAFPAAGA